MFEILNKRIKVDKQQDSMKSMEGNIRWIAFHVLLGHFPQVAIYIGRLNSSQNMNTASYIIHYIRYYCHYYVAKCPVFVNIVLR